MAARPIHFRLVPPLRSKLVERDVINASIHYAGLRGYWAQKIHIGHFRSKAGDWVTIGQPGLPDYLFAHSRFPAFWVEFKRPGRKADIHQLAKHEELRLVWGFRIIVIDAVEDLIAFIAEHERGASVPRDDAAPGCASRP